VTRHRCNYDRPTHDKPNYSNDVDANYAVNKTEVLDGSVAVLRWRNTIHGAKKQHSLCTEGVSLGPPEASTHK